MHEKCRSMQTGLQKEPLHHLKREETPHSDLNSTSEYMKVQHLT